MAYGQAYTTAIREGKILPPVDPITINLPAIPDGLTIDQLNGGDWLERWFTDAATAQGLVYSSPHGKGVNKERHLPFEFYCGTRENRYFRQGGTALFDHCDRGIWRKRITGQSKSECLCHITSPYWNHGKSNPEMVAAYWPRMALIPKTVYFPGAYTYIMCRDGVSVAYDGQALPFVGDDRDAVMAAAKALRISWGSKE